MGTSVSARRVEMSVSPWRSWNQIHHRVWSRELLIQSCPLVECGSLILVQAADGSHLNITERGEIYNPIFRFVSRFILGYNRTMDAYLQNVSRKFNESSLPQDGTASTL